MRTEKVVQHAGSGYSMPEAMARKIDSLSRGLPSDFRYRRMAKAPSGFSLQAGERADVSIITTDAVDRDGECILPAGGDWSGYNSVVPFCHSYVELPVGSCEWMRPATTADGDGIAAKTVYPPKPADWGDAPWLPSAVLHLMQQPVPTCTGKSIGFLPLHKREATRDELSRRPELSGVPIIDRWAGIEYSVVPVPCNAQAELMAVSKGISAGWLSKSMASHILSQGQAMNSATKAGGRFAHLNFVPPHEVQTLMRKGLDQHAGLGGFGSPGLNGGRGCATPEQLATATHLSMGGEASPGMVRQIHNWHEGIGAKAHEHADGSPMHCLSVTLQPRAAAFAGNGGNFPV